VKLGQLEGVFEKREKCCGNAPREVLYSINCRKGRVETLRLAGCSEKWGVNRRKRKLVVPTTLSAPTDGLRGQKRVENGEP